MINFCYDTMSNPDLGYPNLASQGLGPDDFDNTWPRTIAFRLLVYLKHAGAVWTSSTVDQAPQAVGILLHWAGMTLIVIILG